MEMEGNDIIGYIAKHHHKFTVVGMVNRSQITSRKYLVFLTNYNGMITHRLYSASTFHIMSATTRNRISIFGFMMHIELHSVNSN